MTADEIHDNEAFIRFLSQMREEPSARALACENIELADSLEATLAWAHGWHQPVDANPRTHAGSFYE